MAETAAKRRSAQNLRHGSDFPSRQRRQLPHLELPRQLARDELLTRVDELPSRQGMRPPRADLADNLGRFYDALWRHARARQTARFRLTWRQMLAASGYEEKSYPHPERAIKRYAALLAEAGLVDISGRDELADGRTCVVTLQEAPERLESAVGGRRSSAGRATCKAVRRRETRTERASRRERPHCRKGGRGRATPTHDFSWGQYVPTQGLVVPPTGVLPALTQDVPAREAALIDAPEPGTTPGPTAPAALDAAPPPDTAAAIDRLRAQLEGGGDLRGSVELLHEAGRAGWPSVAIAVVAWEALFGGRPGLSHKRRGQLERSCAVLDRIEGRTGWGTDRLLSWMWAVACDLADQAEQTPVGMAPALGRHRLQPAPATLSWFVARLRREARGRRRAWRQARRAGQAPGSSGAETDG